jgi:integrase
LAPQALLALAAHRERQAFERRKLGVAWQEQGLVFPSELGTPLEQGRVHRRWARACTLGGIPRYRLHDLRHTVASHLMANGMNPIEVAQVLGHTGAGLVLDTYGHAVPSSQGRAAAIIDGLLRGQDRPRQSFRYT